MEALDVLAIAAHPDDVELCAGGTICSLTQRGYRVGLLDLTLGELGTRGSVDNRRREAQAAAAIMGVAVRENLELPDGGLDASPEQRNRVVVALRRHRPRIVLANAPVCRHPDHCAAAELVRAASFFAGLARIETVDDRVPQEPWRPQHLLHYMQAISFEPTLVVDVSHVWEQRMKALLAYESQFHNPSYKKQSDEPETFVSNEGFLAWVEARARTYGNPIGAEYAEPFLYHNGPVGVDDLVAVLSRDRPFR